MAENPHKLHFMAPCDLSKERSSVDCSCLTPKQSNVFSFQDDEVQLDQDLILNRKETCILALWSPLRTIPLLLQNYASFCYCTSQSQGAISVTTSPRVPIACSYNDPDPGKIDLGLSLQRLMGFSFGCCSDVLINYRQLWGKKIRFTELKKKYFHWVDKDGE